MARRIWRAMAAAAACVAAAGCTTALAQPGAGEALERIEFALGEVRYHIAMPKGSKLRTSGRPGCIEIRHPRSTRLVKLLELCAPAGPAAATYQRQTTQRNGARVRYDLDHDIGGGSGGAEGELEGVLEIEGRTLALTCRDQGEWGNDPGWCLRYLRSLAIEHRR